MFWQLNDPEPVAPEETLAERIRELGKFADFADELDEPVDSVSVAFPHSPKHHLHVVIQLPSAGGLSSLLPHMRRADDVVSPFTTYR